MKISFKKPNKKSIIAAVLRALPILMIVVMLIVHTTAPNAIPLPPPFFYPEYRIIELSNVWAIFLGILGAGFLAWWVVSLWFIKPQKLLQKGAPLYTAILALIFLYDIATLHTALFNTLFFPWPQQILSAMLNDASGLLGAIGSSLGLLLAGYAIGAVLGIVAGVISGYMGRVNYWVRPVARFFTSVPVITLVPIFIFIPIGFFARAIFLISLAVWVPVTLTVSSGVMAVPKSTFEAASTFGYKGVAMMYKVAIPAASPSIFVGLTQGMAAACVALIIAETMGVSAGIGHYISEQNTFLNYAGMFGGVIMLSFMFFTVNFILSIARKYALKWKGDTAS